MKNKSFVALCVSSMLSMVGFNAAYAGDTPPTNAPPPYDDRITGNWCDKRSALAYAGIDITFEYKADFMANTSGGLKRRGDPGATPGIKNAAVVGIRLDFNF